MVFIQFVLTLFSDRRAIQKYRARRDSLSSSEEEAPLLSADTERTVEESEKVRYKKNIMGRKIIDLKSVKFCINSADIT